MTVAAGHFDSGGPDMVLQVRDRLLKLTTIELQPTKREVFRGG